MYQPYNVPRSFKNEAHHRLIHYRLATSSTYRIVGLWENVEENQPLIGCLIISLTHSLLIEMHAILIIQEAKYKLVYLTRLFIASLTLRLHCTEQCIHKHNTNYTIEKYMHARKNYTMQITCKHSTICS